jgi:hypothetical protein
MSTYVLPVVAGIVLVLVQVLAALPWLYAFDPDAYKSFFRQKHAWPLFLGGVLGAGVVLGLVLAFVIQDRERLLFWGRPYGALLQAQLMLDLFVGFFGVLLLVWPKGGAVAVAAFREGIRQPMFWLLLFIGLAWMVVSPFIPYFTFGEDYKMMRELGHNIIMLLSVVFAVLAAAMSISEEIEGRTAITLMSKPVSRRQFLLGKYVGTLMAALMMTGVLAWAFVVVLWFKPWYDNEPLPAPPWLETYRDAWTPAFGEVATNFVLGAGEWFDVAVAALPGVILGFCQVMVLLAIAVALATRLPMIVNLVTCLVIFFLGHLSQILVWVSERRFPLVNFIAQFFDALLPGLAYFDLGPVIARDVPPPPLAFSIYVSSVALYAVLYSAIALLFGLILFEDRDLA